MSINLDSYSPRMNAPSTPQLSNVPTIRLTTATPSSTPALASPSVLAPRGSIDARRRLVPKKSKLGVSDGSSGRASDVQKSSTGRSFNIYVDPADDPDIGEIVVIKKKKSRAGLNDLQWGPLGDVTNAPKSNASDAQPPAKNGDKDKWWTLRKGKNSKRALSLKALDTQQVREVSAEETPKPAEKASSIRLLGSAKNNGTRQRSHSLDANGLLNGSLYQPSANFISVPMPDDDEEKTPQRPRTRSRASSSIFSTQSSSSNENEGKTHSRNGSIALRAMRSVRSLARMKSWAKFSEDESEADTDVDMKKADKKVKEKKPNKKERTMSISSISSFEALKNTIGTVRRNADKMGTMRSVSSQSTAASSTSSDGTIRNGRRPSTSSDSPEVRVVDTAKRQRRTSGSSTVKREKQSPSEKGRTAARGTKGRRTRRPTLASLFSRSDTSSASESGNEGDSGIAMEPETSVTLAEISVSETAESEETPKKKNRTRPRPVSEQLLSKPRPTGVVSDEDPGTIRILDAATTDLASLINRFDLESTPTPTPRRPRQSTLKKGQRDVMPEQPSPTSEKGKNFSFEKRTLHLSSGRAQRSYSTSAAEVLSHKFDTFLVPSVESDISQGDLADKSMLSESSYKRQSLRSLSSRSIDMSRTEWGYSEARTVSDSFATFGKQGLQDGWSFRSNDLRSLLEKASEGDDVFSANNNRSFSSREHRFSSSSFMSRASLDRSDPLSLAEGSRLSFGSDGPSLTRPHESFILDHPSTMLPPLPPSPSPSQRLDSSPSSSCSVDSVSGASRSQQSWHEALDSPITPEDSVTKRSFDFSEELDELEFEDTSDRQSFAMEIDAAFKTPRKVKRQSQGGRSLLNEASDAPSLPSPFGLQAHQVALPDSPPEDHEGEESFSGNSSSGPLDVDRANSQDLCIKHPSQSSFLGVFSRPKDGELCSNFRFGGPSTSAVYGGADSYEYSLHPSDADSHSFRRSMDSENSAIGKKMSMADFFAALASNGADASVNASRHSLAMTLSDIIPPSMHDSRRGSYYSVNDDEASMLNEIFARAADEAQEYEHSLHDDGSSAFEASTSHSHQRPNMHSRHNSETSFAGLPTFSEIRRGFEYGATRPGFYPSLNPAPPQNKHLLVPGHQWRDSLVSMASVSSYGAILRSGVKDPFGYDYPTTSSAAPPRPISGDLSITVDDTFSFLRKGIRPRLDSDASSLRVPAPPQRRPNAQIRRNRRQGIDSMMSVTSGPPVSLYNRGFSYYGSKQNDTSVAAQLAALLTRNNHQGLRERPSVDSMASGFSARQMGRPGVGDKMFESARDHGIPLSAIAASPSQMDSSQMRSAVMDDDDSHSMLDASDGKSLYSHDSVFDAGQASLQVPSLPPQFRPLSTYTSTSNYSPKRGNASMISMMGSAHVSKQSVVSSLDGSPCARMEKRNRRQFYRRPLERIPSGDAADLLSIPPSVAMSANSSMVSLNDAPPSPASRKSNRSVEHSYHPDESRLSLHFGSNRMNMAQKGLLERQSLEDFCLTGEGEDSIEPPTQTATIAFRRPVRPRQKSNAPSTTTTHSGPKVVAVQKPGSDTPPLCHSGRSSQSTIDIERINNILSNAASTKEPAPRLRKNASELRRRTLEARASRASSIYDTIAEENIDGAGVDEFGMMSSVSQRSSIISIGQNEPALRMIRDLQAEALLALESSQQHWADTAYSSDALQTFVPPRTFAAWKAILEHSQKNFVSLPAEFHGCARRAPSRTFLRTSPYPTNFSMSRRAF